MPLRKNATSGQRDNSHPEQGFAAACLNVIFAHEIEPTLSSRRSDRVPLSSTPACATVPVHSLYLRIWRLHCACNDIWCSCLLSFCASTHLGMRNPPKMYACRLQRT